MTGIIRPWHSVGSLVVDREGTLWEHYQAGYVWHGPIEGARLEGRLGEDLARLRAVWAHRHGPMPGVTAPPG